MEIDFGALIIDLQALVSNSKEDFTNQFWNEYETYLKKYNSILKDLQTLGFFKKLNFIKPVPFSAQEFNSGFSKEEKGKLREITNASDILLKKVKLLLLPSNTNKKNKNLVRSDKIFLVHGQDEKMKLDVTQLLQTLDLDPIILNEKSNKDSTIFEKIAENSNISFAIVLLSPDDLAYSKEKTPKEAKFRSKQNLIFELGYLLGKLGKQNVIAIYHETENFEIPNERNEVVLIKYKTGWDIKLIEELQASNFEVDSNKISWL